MYIQEATEDTQARRNTRLHIKQIGDEHEGIPSDRRGFHRGPLGYLQGLINRGKGLRDECHLNSRGHGVPRGGSKQQDREIYAANSIPSKAVTRLRQMNGPTTITYDSCAASDLSRTMT
jgi:hypothetical protein